MTDCSAPLSAHEFFQDHSRRSAVHERMCSERERCERFLALLGLDADEVQRRAADSSNGVRMAFDAWLHEGHSLSEFRVILSHMREVALASRLLLDISLDNAAKKDTHRVSGASSKNKTKKKKSKTMAKKKSTPKEKAVESKAVARKSSGFAAGSTSGADDPLASAMLSPYCWRILLLAYDDDDSDALLPALARVEWDCVFVVSGQRAADSDLLHRFNASTARTMTTVARSSGKRMRVLERVACRRATAAVFCAGGDSRGERRIVAVLDELSRCSRQPADVVVVAVLAGAVALQCKDVARQVLHNALTSTLRASKCGLALLSLALSEKSAAMLGQWRRALDYEVGDEPGMSATLLEFDAFDALVAPLHDLMSDNGTDQTPTVLDRIEFCTHAIDRAVLKISPHVTPLDLATQRCVHERMIALLESDRASLNAQVADLRRRFLMDEVRGVADWLVVVATQRFLVQRGLDPIYCERAAMVDGVARIDKMLKRHSSIHTLLVRAHPHAGGTTVGWHLLRHLRCSMPALVLEQFDSETMSLLEIIASPPAPAKSTPIALLCDQLPNVQSLRTALSSKSVRAIIIDVQTWRDGPRTGKSNSVDVSASLSASDETAFWRLFRLVQPDAPHGSEQPMPIWGALAFRAISARLDVRIESFVERCLAAPVDDDQDPNVVRAIGVVALVHRFASQAGTPLSLVACLCDRSMRHCDSRWSRWFSVLERELLRVRHEPSGATLQLPTPAIADLVGKIALRQSAADGDLAWIERACGALVDCLVEHADVLDAAWALDLWRDLFVRRASDQFSPLVMLLDKECGSDVTASLLRQLSDALDDPLLACAFVRYLVHRTADGYAEAMRVVEQLASECDGAEGGWHSHSSLVTCADVYRHVIKTYFARKKSDDAESLQRFVASLSSGQLAKEPSAAEAHIKHLFQQADAWYSHCTVASRDGALEANPYAYGGRAKLYTVYAQGVYASACRSRDKVLLCKRLGAGYFDTMLRWRDDMVVTIERYGVESESDAYRNVDESLLRLLSLCVDPTTGVLPESLENALLPLQLLDRKPDRSWSELSRDELRRIVRTFQAQHNMAMQATHRNAVLALLNLARCGAHEASLAQVRHRVDMWREHRPNDFLASYWRALVLFAGVMDGYESNAGESNVLHKSSRALARCRSQCSPDGHTGGAEWQGFVQRVQCVIAEGSGAQRLCPMDMARTVADDNPHGNIHEAFAVRRDRPRAHWFRGKLLDRAQRREVIDSGEHMHVLTNDKEKWMFVFRVGAKGAWVAVAVNSRVKQYHAPLAEQHALIECLVGFSCVAGGLAFMARSVAACCPGLCCFCLLFCHSLCRRTYKMPVAVRWHCRSEHRQPALEFCANKIKRPCAALTSRARGYSEYGGVWL